MSAAARQHRKAKRFFARRALAAAEAGDRFEALRLLGHALNKHRAELLAML